MTIRMQEYNVLIEQDDTKDKIGMILIPEMAQERQRHAETHGRIAGLSPMAFTWDDWPDGAEKPKVGDRVMFAQFAGIFAEVDGKRYRVIKDKDVIAVIE